MVLIKLSSNDIGITTQWDKRRNLAVLDSYLCGRLGSDGFELCEKYDPRVGIEGESGTLYIIAYNLTEKDAVFEKLTATMKDDIKRLVKKHKD